MTPAPNPFQRPTAPKSGLELLKWAIFEPVVFIKFYKSLSKMQIFAWLIGTYFGTLLIVMVLSFVVNPLMGVADLMTIAIDLNYFVFLAVLFFVVIRFKITPKDLFDAVFGFIFLLVLGTIFIEYGVIEILLDQVKMGYSSSIISLVTSLILMTFTTGILVSIIYLSLLITFVLISALPFYLYHLLRILFPIDFYHNPHLSDGVIWLPLPTVRTRLTRLAYQQPETALAFVNFLLEYRPLQRKLAMHLLHAATAGQWALYPLDADKLLPPNIAKDTEQFIPSNDWMQQLGVLKQQLISSQTQSNIGLRKTKFEKFFNFLTEFRALTLRESRLWHGYYLGCY